MLWTKLLYFITFSDLDLAYINLNHIFHTSSHDNDRMGFNPSINDDLKVQIHIFIFLSEIRPLCVTMTLAAGI
jgi:5'-3' exonuclease